MLEQEQGREALTVLLRKEVVHPLLPERIPCYDLVLIADLAVVRLPHKGWSHSLRALPTLLA